MRKHFMDALRAVSSKAEEEVFRREVSEEELAATGGAMCGLNGDADCGQPADYIMQAVSRTVKQRWKTEAGAN